MPYYKTKEANLLFIHIPKTGGTSLENYLKNKYSETLFGHRIPLTFQSFIKNSLQHQTYNTIYKYRDVLDVDFNNINTITIVRNPYDRIISDLSWFGLIDKKNTNQDTVYKVINKYLSSNNLDNHIIPQYLFITDQYENIIPNITIFRTESLTKGLHEYGYTDYKGRGSVNTYREYLNDDSIKVLNEFYAKDFKLFNYPIREVREK